MQLAQGPRWQNVILAGIQSVALNHDFVYLFEEVTENISKTFQFKLTLKDEQRLTITS
jgi:hypothetical protein